MNKYWMQFSLAFLLFVTVFAQAADSVQTTAIVGGTLVDIYGKSSVKNAVILVENDRITAIGTTDDVEIPEGARQIDAQGKWLIPGLMNMHVHLPVSHIPYYV